MKPQLTTLCYLPTGIGIPRPTGLFGFGIPAGQANHRIDAEGHLVFDRTGIHASEGPYIQMDREGGLADFSGLELVGRMSALTDEEAAEKNILPIFHPSVMPVHDILIFKKV